MLDTLTRIFGFPTDTAANLLSWEELRSVLERERMRADRAGRPLALLAITLPVRRRRRAQVHRLASIVQQRIRATDVAGYLGDGRVGVLLPDTSEEAAWRVADDMREAFDQADQRLEIEILVHPFESPDADDRGERQASTGAAAPRRTSAALQQQLIRPLPAWKRGLDVVGASLGLFTFAPLLAAAALAIRCTSRGPVLFAQRRAGLGGRPFTMLKFRTMCVDAEQKKQALQAQNEQDGPAFKIKHDPRVTLVGRYLRITCVDELPQLWNVLRGDMTLVGPRPLPVDESDRCQDWERRRLDVTPGLTCIWQAAGRRDSISFADWMRMDLRYIRFRSIRRDLALLWRTFVNVVTHRASH